jgi:hypothetical protein
VLLSSVDVSEGGERWQATVQLMLAFCNKLWMQPRRALISELGRQYAVSWKGWEDAGGGGCGTAHVAAQMPSTMRFPARCLRAAKARGTGECVLLFYWNHGGPRERCAVLRAPQEPIPCGMKVGFEAVAGD